MRHNRVWSGADSDDPIRATVSIGVASSAAGAPAADELVHAADLALYRAEDAGRNRVVRAAASATEAA
jgi:PleD family two-component response regulator